MEYGGRLFGSKRVRSGYRILIALSLFLFTSSSQATEAPEKLIVGYSGAAPGFSVVWIAKDTGIFKKNGLDVDIILVQSASLMAQALIAGNVPVAVMNGVAAVEGNLRGADLVLIGSLKKSPNTPYLVTSKGINRPNELKGKKLGVSRIGSSSDVLLRLALRKLGINPDREVTILQLGNVSLRTKAIQAGIIDGHLVSPEEKVASETFGVNILYDLRALGLEFLSTDMVTSRVFIKNEEEKVRRFVKAMVEAIHYYKTHKQKSIEIMAKYMRNVTSRVIEMGYDWNAQEYNSKPYPSVRGIQWALEEIAQRNPKAEKTTPEQFYDARFVKELEQNGFIDSLYR